MLLGRRISPYVIINIITLISEIIEYFLSVRCWKPFGFRYAVCPDQFVGCRIILQRTGRIGDTENTLVLGFRFLVLTSLRCHQYNTVTGLRTINRSTGRIFQEADIIYLIRVQGIKGRFIFDHIINNEQRFTKATTHTDFGRSTCHTGSSCYRYTRSTSRQRIRQVRGRDLVQIIRFHGSDGTGQIHLFLRTVTYYHNLIDQLRIFFQCDH